MKFQLSAFAVLGKGVMLRTVQLVLLIVLVGSQQFLQASILDPGGIITVDESGQIRRFGFSGGTATDILQVQSNPVDAPTGIEVLNGRLYVTGANDRVAEINPLTGALISSFASGLTRVNSLGSDGTNLLVGNFTEPILVFSPSGVLQGQVTLPGAAQFLGVDGNGSDLFVGHWTGGDYANQVTTHDTAGNLLSSFSASAEGTRIRGTAYDSSTDTIWVVRDTPTPNQITQYSRTGIVLSQFTVSSSNFINGIDVIPAAVIPEPTTLVIWSILGGIGLVVGHRRRKRKAT